MTPIFVIPPTLVRVNKYVLTEDRWREHVLFASDDPWKQAKLYELESRYDIKDLNQAGASEFSRVFGEDFAGWLAANPQGQP